MSPGQARLLRELARRSGMTDEQIEAHALPELSALPCILVTTSMGRRAHLERSLPSWLSYTPCNIVVVDWSCPQHSGDWAEEQSARVLAVRDTAEHFHKTAALNIGIRRALTEIQSVWSGQGWVMVLDADTVILPGFWTHVVDHARPDRFMFMAGDPEKKDLSGLLLATAQTWASAPYDERFQGWGLEDWDQRCRMHFDRGLDFDSIPSRFAEPLRHSDDLRVAHQADPDKMTTYRRNWRLINSNVKGWTGQELHELEHRRVRWLFGGFW